MVCGGVDVCDRVPPQAKLELDEDDEEEKVVGQTPMVALPTDQEDEDQILQNLIQTTELFDQKNSEYMVMEQKSEAFRKVLTGARISPFSLSLCLHSFSLTLSLSLSLFPPLIG